VQSSRHLDYDRQRHADLLRRARSGELAASIAAARETERRFALAMLLRARQAPRPLPIS
jgi:uncharacterized membrane protein